MLPLDPQADPGRRAWVACPKCADARGCEPCEQRRTCSTHWRYLLTNTGSMLHLQCPGCTHVWVHESGFGATRSLWDRGTGARPDF
ncbi:hypothetical protein [Streptomyces xanthophaeus]|uniref:hypothetical protein n=1 Tax=Streptomyces xanthophaeus TaxID=67385 RepID=UPI002648DDFC|nr:hypothetical protein [Streptomyces xanthophaeus]WKD36473.1 hypothetical protein KO717_34100 [Streptomyces xanthophaeus]